MATGRGARDGPENEEDGSREGGVAPAIVSSRESRGRRTRRMFLLLGWSVGARERERKSSFFRLALRVVRREASLSGIGVDGIENFALGFAGFEIFVTLGRLVEGKSRVDGNFEIARLEPGHDLVGAI